jgi:hypothetical protein
MDERSNISQRARGTFRQRPRLERAITRYLAQQMEARMDDDPMYDRGMFVGPVVVADQMQHWEAGQVACLAHKSLRRHHNLPTKESQPVAHSP